jgi:hypothetical protein
MTIDERLQIVQKNVQLARELLSTSVNVSDNRNLGLMMILGSVSGLAEIAKDQSMIFHAEKSRS